MIQQFFRPRAWRLLNFSIQYNRTGATSGLTFRAGPDMTRIRNALSLILSFRERLNYFMYPYAETNGQPVRNLQTHFSFGEISAAQSTAAGR
jgi:hypothetical protein